MRKFSLVALLPLLAVLAAGCGSSSSKTTNNSTSTPSSSSSSSGAKGSGTISTATIKPYGTVLVNGAGHALYLFLPDKAKKVTCTGNCATIWPPVKSSGKASASGQVKSSLLGSDPDPGGGQVATYNGWPLYTYVTDTAPGVAHGEGLNLNGGIWYLMSPSGKPVKPQTSTSSGQGY